MTGNSRLKVATDKGEKYTLLAGQNYQLPIATKIKFQSRDTALVRVNEQFSVYLRKYALAMIKPRLMRMSKTLMAWSRSIILEKIRFYKVINRK
jgi:hypothetical protein